jgi:hypothetical protein
LVILAMNSLSASTIGSTVKLLDESGTSTISGASATV